MIPTFEQYLEAMKIVEAYENHNQHLFEIRLKAFEDDLREYFKNNKVANLQIIDFELQKQFGDHYCIYPFNPAEENFDECYNGDNDFDIKQLAEKHDVHVNFVSWMYSK